MSRYAKLFAANAIAAAGLGAAAIALSSPAVADPVMPPAVPGLPALGMLQDFANPAGVGAVLQTAATALNGASSMIGAPAPNTLPVSPIAVPGAAPVAVAPVAPVAPAPQPGIGATVVPLLNQIGVPAQLANLVPQNLPLISSPPAVNPAFPVAPVAAPIAPIAPAAAPVAPVAPVAPGSTGINPLPLLTAALP